MEELDHDRLMALVGKLLGDLGGAYSVPTARIGFRLGLFDALADAPASAAEHRSSRWTRRAATCAA